MSRTKKLQRGGLRIDGADKKGLEIFSSQPGLDIPKSWCNLSHPHSTSLDMGYLVPILCEEVVPGDYFKFAVEGFMRMSPMIAPIMANVDISYYWFFVPERILWADQTFWEAHIMGRNTDESLPDTVDWAYFVLEEDSAPIGSIGNYMGLNPPLSGNTINVKAAPIAGYLKVYDNYFRSEQLQPELFTPLVPGNNSIYNSIVDFNPLNIGWQHDYFTSCLPTPQVGLPVLIPLTTGAVPVTVNEAMEGIDAMKVRSAINSSLAGSGNVSTLVGDLQGAGIPGGVAYIDPNGWLQVDPNSSAASIPDLRLSFRMQSYFEAEMRNGSQFHEWLYTMFNIMSSDARLQRAEYLGMYRHKMAISQVLATANTMVDTAETFVGQMAGHGISYGSSHNEDKQFEEHGFLYCLCSVVPETKYGQGISKMWLRDNYLDYLIPMFSNVNEQEVKRIELQAALTPEQQNETFGYIPRYSEYKYRNGRFSGLFQTDLDYWHMGRILDPEGIPYLNGAFIAADPTTRIYAVEEGQHILAEFNFNISAHRPVAKFGIPTLM